MVAALCPAPTLQTSSTVDQAPLVLMLLPTKVMKPRHSRVPEHRDNWGKHGSWTDRLISAEVPRLQGLWATLNAN